MGNTCTGKKVASSVVHAPAAQTPISQPVRVLQTHKHLIVDDSHYNLIVLRRFLNSINIIVDEAKSGEECLKAVEENGEYSIIWMDLRLCVNEMDGIECTRRLRVEKDYGGVIIGLTGYVDELTYETCMHVGMTHFMSKPFSRRAVAEYSRRYKEPNAVVFQGEDTPHADNLWCEPVI